MRTIHDDMVLFRAALAIALACYCGAYAPVSRLFHNDDPVYYEWTGVEYDTGLVFPLLTDHDQTRDIVRLTYTVGVYKYSINRLHLVSARTNLTCAFARTGTRGDVRRAEAYVSRSRPSRLRHRVSSSQREYGISSFADVPSSTYGLRRNDPRTVARARYVRRGLLRTLFTEYVRRRGRSRVQRRSRTVSGTFSASTGGHTLVYERREPPIYETAPAYYVRVGLIVTTSVLTSIFLVYSS